MSQTESSKESLSALLDNEADDLELRRLLKSCETNPELAETWERYNLVQSLLHNEAVPVSKNLVNKVSAAIADEPAYTGENSAATGADSKASGWQPIVAKFAIAASVAVAFFLTVQSSLDNNSVPAGATLVGTEIEQPDQSQAAGDQTPSALVASSGTFQVDPEAQQRLVEYLESMTFDESEPVRTEHIQDSSLYRLVNDLQAKP